MRRILFALSLSLLMIDFLYADTIVLVENFDSTTTSVFNNGIFSDTGLDTPATSWGNYFDSLTENTAFHNTTVGAVLLGPNADVAGIGCTSLGFTLISGGDSILYEFNFYNFSNSNGNPSTNHQMFIYYHVNNFVKHTTGVLAAHTAGYEIALNNPAANDISFVTHDSGVRTVVSSQKLNLFGGALNFINDSHVTMRIYVDSTTHTVNVYATDSLTVFDTRPSYTNSSYNRQGGNKTIGVERFYAGDVATTNFTDTWLVTLLTPPGPAIEVISRPTPKTSPTTFGALGGLGNTTYGNF